MYLAYALNLFVINFEKMNVLPYNIEDKSKKEQVANMFNNISAKYDFLNRLLSIGIDVLWRKAALSFLKKDNPKKILDVATGTADFALEAHRQFPDAQIIGVDISVGMLEKGKKKIQKLEEKIQLQLGDSERLLFEDNTFDAVIVAFGVRNFENLEKGLIDMLRVLKPKGKVVILEFSKPKKTPIKQLYNFYFKNILPNIGKMVSKDARAYTYLPESVQAFPEGKDFVAILEKTGFKNVSCKALSFGISSVYVGEKEEFMA
ncbi:MAG: bifunctional demethylmenaquinone methyltransferase/2-methoxy-6-polyprenyl-1,4-benzoquinol methylase UbiE [Raineya sp.]